ncbi:AAA family ATPase [Rhizobium rhizogenes]|uniref:AAA family ATPase n=1 Tax=Rhizobium rhizogenes TaxID=359 RepID=A0AA92C5G8_RHIRH|nr:AAA family ATPase [Rhizobium rhizogenes]PVE56381.1 AAA family ATPase [Rhizobium rhizogenes]PVE64876.1 AAA family ATPase [Agrobacterium tumefaciens]PVE74014.1 AAA family ATPase [Sphingomonas sp. TPD3009]
MIIVNDTKEAAEIIKSSRRLLVMGCSGNGKSTLSNRLSERLGLPHISCDRDIFWLPGWKLRPRPEIVERMTAFAAEDRWIIDGNSPGTLPLRLPRTEAVIWLRFPRWMSLTSVVKRWLRYRGKVRPEMAEGCPEKIDAKFLSYIWNFEKTESPEIVQHLEAARRDLPVIILTSYQDTNRMLSDLDSAIGGELKR